MSSSWICRFFCRNSGLGHFNPPSCVLFVPVVFPSIASLRINSSSLSSIFVTWFSIGVEIPLICITTGFVHPVDQFLCETLLNINLKFVLRSGIRPEIVNLASSSWCGIHWKMKPFCPTIDQLSGRYEPLVSFCIP